MSEFAGRVAIVTGGSRGIGRTIVEQLLDQGAKVAVVGISADNARQTATELGENAIGIGADVANYDACKAAIDSTVEAFGKLDILINNAGIGGIRKLTADHGIEDWQRVIDVNLNGVFYCTKAAVPEMQKSGGGAIVNIASIDGLIGMASLSHYCASKHAVIGFTKSFALEYGKDNIRCNAVAPGFIKTDMTKDSFSDEETNMVISLIALKRQAKPEEVANAVTWLASEKASYVTGACFVVDAGLTSGIGV